MSTWNFHIVCYIGSCQRGNWQCYGSKEGVGTYTTWTQVSTRDVYCIYIDNGSVFMLCSLLINGRLVKPSVHFRFLVPSYTYHICQSLEAQRAKNCYIFCGKQPNSLPCFTKISQCTRFLNLFLNFINMPFYYSRQVLSIVYSWLTFCIFLWLILLNIRAAIFQKVADLIAGKYRIQSLAATMVGQVRETPSGLRTSK